MHWKCRRFCTPTLVLVCIGITPQHYYSECRLLHDWKLTLLLTLRKAGLLAVDWVMWYKAKKKVFTMPRKNVNLPYFIPYICTEFFFLIHKEFVSSYLYASFGTFCIQIGQLFEAQWVFENSKMAVFEGKRRWNFSESLKSHCDKFVCKRCQKKRKDMS